MLLFNSFSLYTLRGMLVCGLYFVVRNLETSIRVSFYLNNFEYLCKSVQILQECERDYQSGKVTPTYIFPTNVITNVIPMS